MLLAQRQPCFHGQQLVVGVGVGQFTADYLMVHDPQLLEHCLSEHEPDGIRCFREQPIRVNHDAQRIIKALPDRLQGDCQLGDDLLGCRNFVTRLVLLSFEVFQAESVSIVGFFVFLSASSDSRWVL